MHQAKVRHAVEHHALVHVPLAGSDGRPFTVSAISPERHHLQTRRGER
jgi:hypothetical protein